MSDPVKVTCPTCEGHGRVASHNGKSWKQFQGLPYGSDEMTGVREGQIEPQVCPTCKGAKFILETPAT